MLHGNSNISKISNIFDNLKVPWMNIYNLPKSSFLDSSRTYQDIYLRFCTNHVNKSFHYHPQGGIEPFVVIKGNCIHSYEGVETPLTAGCVFVIPKEKGHSFNECHNLQLINIGFNKDYWIKQDEQFSLLVNNLEKEFSNNDNIRVLSYTDLNCIIDLADLLYRELYHENKYDYIFIKALLLQMVIILLRVADNSNVRQFKEESEVNSEAYIYEHILNVLRSYYSKENTLHINDYLEKYKISYSKFLRYFKNIVSLSPKQMEMTVFIYKVRKEILNTPYLSLQEIANNIGVENYSYFSRMFKSKFKITPNQMKSNIINDCEES